MPTQPVDLSDQDLESTDRALGELVRMLLSRDGIALLVFRADGNVVTTLSPSTVQSEDLATALLGEAEWSEDEVMDFLNHRRTS